MDYGRSREARGYDAGRWENEGGRAEGEREGRGNFPRYEDRSREYQEDYRRDENRRDENRRDDFNRERGEGYGGSRRADFSQRGDWGRQGSWGAYGNRPGYDDRGRSFFRHDDEGLQHNQLGGMSAGHSSGMWTSGAGGGYGSSYSGGMGSYSGGFSGEQGRSAGSFAGKGPKNWQRSDDRIKEDVNERLTEHEHIDASDIDVQVRSGEVTLTGSVSDRRVKRLVEDLVEGVSGVKEVHNQLRTSQQQGGEREKEKAQTSGAGVQSRK